MLFHECESLAKKRVDLVDEINKIDKALSSLNKGNMIIIRDWSVYLSIEDTLLKSIFEDLVNLNLLEEHKLFYCKLCDGYVNNEEDCLSDQHCTEEEQNKYWNKVTIFRLQKEFQNLNDGISMSHVKHDVLSILFLNSAPHDAQNLRVDIELREIRDKVSKASESHLIKLNSEWAVRVEDLQGHILKHEPTIVHFSGHGSNESELIFENKYGTGVEIPKEALTQLFGLVNTHVKCVVLNACYSSDQAEGIAQEVDAVVGMYDKINDDTAISFSWSFYQALAYGTNLQKAFDLACNQLALENDPQYNIPILHQKPGINLKQLVLVSSEESA